MPPVLSFVSLHLSAIRDLPMAQGSKKFHSYQSFKQAVSGGMWNTGYQFVFVTLVAIVWPGVWQMDRIQSLGGADYSYTNMVPSPKVQLGGGYSDGGDAMPSQFRRAWRLRHAIHVMAAKGCPKEWRPRPGPAVTTPSLPPSRSPPSSQDSKPQTAEYAAVPSPSQACTRMGWTRVQAAADTERPRAC